MRAYWLLMVATDKEIQNFKITVEKQILENVTIPTAAKMLVKLRIVKEIQYIVEIFKEFKFFSLKHVRSIVYTGRNSVIQYQMGLKEETRVVLVKQVNGFIMMAA